MPTTAYSPDEQSLDALFAAHEHLAADLATPDRALQRSPLARGARPVDVP